MGVSENSGTPKSSILIGFSIINYTSSILGYPYFRNPPYDIVIYSKSRIKKVMVRDSHLHVYILPTYHSISCP